ncbi:unnamed protein product, partial [Didymodactylos carnosus]
WTTDNTTQQIIGFTETTTIEAYLPLGDPNLNYTLNIVAQIRDLYGGITQYQIKSIQVVPDSPTLLTFMSAIENVQNRGRTNITLEQLLFGGDQNMICQVLLSMSQMLNAMSMAAQQLAVTVDLPGVAYTLDKWKGRTCSVL